jgi:hypothetical protein
MAQRKKYAEPVERDVRICFAIAWFTSEDDAQAFAEAYPSHVQRWLVSWPTDGT